MIKYIFIFLMVSTYSFAAVSLGYIEKVNGRVSVYHENNVRAEKAKDNTKVFLNDIIKTKRNSTAIVALNNSKITLFQRSRMVIYDVQNPEKSADIKTGRVLFEVNSGDIKGEFKVNTPDAVIGVKGTKFMVEVLNGYSLVSVNEGVVAVTVNGFHINIRKGQRVRFRTDSIDFKNLFDKKNYDNLYKKSMDIYNDPTMKMIVGNIKPKIVEHIEEHPPVYDDPPYEEPIYEEPIYEEPPSEDYPIEEGLY